MTTPDQPAAPVQQGATELPDSIRVPLDSLHADALYLTSRVAQGTMSAVRLSQVIRERIDAAKAALQAAPQQWQSLTDGEWVNIVNSDEVKNEGSDVHGAVCVAFKMIEKRLREKNEFSHPAPGAGQQEVSGIYVASRASIPERPMMWQGLRLKGWPITSSWIDEAGEGETADMGELWRRIHDEIARSSGVLLYAEADDFPLKGALIECGIALGMGKPVALVLPHVRLEPRSMKPLGSWAAHPLVTRYDTLEDARAALVAARHHPVEAQQAASGGEESPDWQLMTALAELDGVNTEDKNGCLEAARACIIKARSALLASRAAPAAPAVEVVTEDIERMAVNRYRPVPAGVIAYKVLAGDGDRSLFSGTKDECYIVARKLTEAFLDGAFSALTLARKGGAK